MVPPYTPGTSLTSIVVVVEGPVSSRALAKEYIHKYVLIVFWRLTKTTPVDYVRYARGFNPS